MDLVLFSFLVLANVPWVFIWLCKRWLARKPSERSHEITPNHDASSDLCRPSAGRSESAAIEPGSEEAAIQPAHSELEILPTMCKNTPQTSHSPSASTHTGNEMYMNKIISAVTGYVEHSIQQ
jgi:hypothetical protein